MVTKRDYTAEGVEAARSVLVELVHLLGEYKDDIVLIGGWVPELSLPHQSEGHIGSMDVDLALNHQKIQDAGYKMIQDLLKSRGYPAPGPPPAPPEWKALTRAWQKGCVGASAQFREVALFEGAFGSSSRGLH